MEQILQNIKEILGVPAFLINQCPILPQYIKLALIDSINFIPWLYILYYGIELLEKLVQKLGPLFGVAIANVPECGYQVIASTFYSRRMMTRGTLLAFLIAGSDDALPLLFMDLSKAFVIIPIVIIKIIVGIVVAYSVDIFDAITSGKKKLLEDVNVINSDLNEPACCHHRIQTVENPPYWYMHPFTHTFNMFMFTFICLAFFYCLIQSNAMGSAETLANFFMINSPIQVIVTAVLGMVSNCFVSVFLAVAYVKGIISFPALLSGLITVTGLGLMTLTKRCDKKSDVTFITGVMLVVAIAVGLVAYYNMQVLDIVKDFIVR